MSDHPTHHTNANFGATNNGIRDNGASPDDKSMADDAIVPASITLNAAPSPFSDTGSQLSVWKKQRWTLMGLAASVVLALLVVFVLPHYIQPTPQIANSQEPNNSSGSAANGVTAEQSPKVLPESPWQDAQLAKGRRETQDLLAEMLDRQKQLESKNVLLWAESEFLAAQAHANEADGFYREQNFSAAKQNYQNALTQFDALLAKSTEIFSDALSDGESALQAGDQVTALQQFQLANAIDPDDATAIQGLQRAESLDELLSHMVKGDRLQRDGDLDGAAEHYAKARALDSQFIAAQEKTQALNSQIRDRDFARQMSAGFSAMQSNQYAQAVAAFTRALAIKPSAADAQAALAQAKNQQTDLTIEQWLQQAQQHEASENWSEAVASYDKALALDNSVVAARVGKIQAATRADIDQRMQAILAAPERLATPQVHAQYQTFYEETAALKNPGSQLTAQLQALKNALEVAVQPVKVTFVSDSATTVRVNRVAELGIFDSTTLNLKPGNYSAVGTRPGYRDVRKDFTVPAAATSFSVTVECVEKIGNG